MSNKKVLSQAKAKLNSAKAPAKPKDIIYDPMGQWKFPGLPTRIPSSNITMQDVPFPVMAYPNIGQPVLMQPGGEYNFPNADYVDEYPQMRRGGLKKGKTSRNPFAINKAFAKHQAFRKPKKNVIFDPKSPNFQDGGVSPLEGDLISNVIMNRNKGVDFVDRAYALGDNPGTPMFNTFDDEEFGSNMSHKMAWGEDDNGQTWMFPTIFNPNNEAIQVPNQYADYISNKGYKNATGMNYQDGGFIMDLTDDEIQTYKDGGYIVEDISVPELQDGGEPELKQDLQEQVVYGNEAKRKLQGSLIDKYNQAKGAYQDYRENAGLTKQRLKNEGASSIGVLQGQIKEYKNQLEEEKKTYDRAQKALNVLQKKDPKNWKDKKLKDVMSSQGVDALRDLYSKGEISEATHRDFYNNFGQVFDRETKTTSEEDQKKLEKSWYGNGRWMDNPMNVAKVAKVAPYAALAAAGAPAVLPILANPLVQAGLTGYGVYDAATNSIPQAFKDFKKGDYKGAAWNAGMAALDLAPIPLFGTNLIDDASRAGKYLTTQTPLKNAYKINPFALKEAQETMLVRARPVGQDPYINMAEQIRAKEAAGEPLTWYQRNLMNPQSNPQMAAREKYFGQWFADNPSDLDFYINPGTRNFADDAQIEILKTRLPKSEAAKYSVKNFDDAKQLSNLHDSEYILPKDMVQSLERVPVEDLGKLQIEYKQMNTPHWLRGHKPVEVPKQLTGSPNVASSVDDVGKGLKSNSGTLNAGVSPDLIKNVAGPSNKVGANILDQMYIPPFFNKTLNKISPLNYVPGYGKKLEGAVKPLGNVINKNIKNGNLVEQKGIIGQAKDLVGKGVDQPITTKLNRSNADIYSASFNDKAGIYSDITFGDPLKQGVIGRTFNKKNALTPLQSKRTGNALSEIPLTDSGVALNRRLPFSNRYVPIDKQKLLNNEFQWATTGAGLQNVGEKFVKSIPTYGLIGGGLGALMYNPRDYFSEEELERIDNENIDINTIKDVPTRTDVFKEDFQESISSPQEFLSQPDPYGAATIGSLFFDYKKGGIVTELSMKEIKKLIAQGYIVEEID
jgi:hypothetical protein